MAAFHNLSKMALAAGTVGAATLLYGSQDPVAARNWHSNAHLKYPASANYPDLTKHNNHMADQLTPSLYAKLRDKATSNGFTLDQCIQTGVDNPGNKFYGKKTGLVAGDEESYEVYKELFDKVIEAIHGFKPDDTHKTDLTPSKLVGGTFDDKYVKSCRVRTARSIRGLCLPPGTTRAERREVERLVSGALGGLSGDLAGNYYPLATMSNETQEQLIADHFLFDKPEGALLLCSGMARDWPDGRGIWHNGNKDFLVWLNEEDHIRVISMQKGGDMRAVFDRFCRGLNQVEGLISAKGWEFQWNQHHGYISTCPSNLGTGMRAGVHVCLKLLCEHPKFDSILKTLRLGKRGTGGEATVSTDGTFDISNAERLGKSEVELMQLLIDGVDLLIKMEKRLEAGEVIDDLIPN